MEARCAKKCPCRIHVSWTKKNDTFIAKKYVRYHECAKPASTKWIAKQFLEKIRQNLEINVVELMRDLH